MTAKLAAADVSGRNGAPQHSWLSASVNANKRHWYKATEVLARADRAWLATPADRDASGRRISKRALQRTPDDIKVVVQFSEA